MQVPFLSFKPTQDVTRQEMLLAFEQFYDSGWYILGSRLKAFEAAYAAFNQTAYCIGVSNGLDALTLALKALDIGPGDEVIVPSHTFIASALAVTHVGAVPVFAEPDPETYNIDPENIEAHIGPKTRAVMPVHLYGQACDMGCIMQIASANNLFVVEDNAQAQGASFAGRLTGSWGTINATSFYPGKNLGALGDAGAVTTDHEAYAKSVSMLRNYGSRVKYENEKAGHNMRLDELQAAFLNVKLKYLDGWNVARQEAAGWYSERLFATGDLVLPLTHTGSTHVYHLYVIRTAQRAALQNYLQSKGVSTLIHYPIPPHLQEAYQYLGHRKGDFPIAELIASTCLSLPMFPGISEEEVDYVCECIKAFFWCGG